MHGDKMIREIEIMIKNGCHITHRIQMILEEKRWITNTKKVIEDEQIKRLQDIMLNWKKEYGKSNVIDAEEFQIRIISSNWIEEYHGCGNYPDNYQELKEIIGELDGR